MDHNAGVKREANGTPMIAGAKGDLLDFASGTNGPANDRAPGALLIEDDPIMLKAMEHGLRKRGFTVWTALEGKEAVDLYRRFEGQIDIVLSDVQMPGMNGPETLTALRQWNPFICFCFMTGDIRRSTSQRLLDSGALRVFTKPFPSVASVAEELWMIVRNPQDFSSIGLKPVRDDFALAITPEPTLVETSERPAAVGFLRRILAPLLGSTSNLKKAAIQNPVRKSR